MKKRRTKLSIRRGDQVKVIAGNDKNKVGVVEKVLPSACRAVVKGVAMVKKHCKPTAQNPEGTIVEQEGTIHMSNLMVLAPETETPSKIGRKKDERTGKLVRYAKKNGKELNNAIS